MTFKLPKLKFKKNSLIPIISEEAINYHYDKHHHGYIKNLNNLIEKSDLKTKSLEEIIRSSTGKIFNNAAQIWNHNFYWNCLKSNSNDKNLPKRNLMKIINKNFDNFENFKTIFIDTALNNFGSGWTWLIKEKKEDKLKILNTSNASNPLINQKLNILLTIDVWEHAYYIDYRNDRLKYLENIWNIINWDFVEKQIT